MKTSQKIGIVLAGLMLTLGGFVTAATWEVTEIYEDGVTILMFTSTNNTTATGNWDLPGGLNEVQVLAIGGGGGGGTSGGGGGAGGLVFETYPIAYGTSAISVQVGGGGASTTAGGHTLFGSLQADGGGHGGAGGNDGGSGGSGGGAGRASTVTFTLSGGSTSGQGFGGGDAHYDAAFAAGRQGMGAGGGGAGAAGQNSYPNTSATSTDRFGDGGIGVAFSAPLFGDFFKDITETEMRTLLNYAAFLGFAGGGGGGGGQSHEWQGSAVTGYGGGNAMRGNAVAGLPGFAHTGGGGGGGAHNGNGGAGGSGVIFVSYTPPPKGTVLFIR